MQPDTVLLKRIKEDDEAALEELFHKYYFNLCDFSFTYVRSIEIAEEVVSDVFLKIWQQRMRMRIYKNFKSYIYTATRNQSLNYIQKDQNRLEMQEELSEEPVISHYHPEEELIFQELENKMEFLINTLPPRRKLIFKLSRIEGFKYSEIAEILSISVHTVQNQMVEAVKELASYSILDK